MDIAYTLGYLGLVEARYELAATGAIIVCPEGAATLVALKRPVAQHRLGFFTI